MVALLQLSTGFVLPQERSHVATLLQLVPGQGNQLAAYNAAHHKDEEDVQDNDEADNDFEALPMAITVGSEPDAANSNSRNLVKRAFNLPSNMIRRHPHPKVELIESPTASKSSNTLEDIVLYPLVGFTFCRNGDRVVALPTTSNVSCCVPISHKGELYGWFSPVCKLDMYSEDPCHAPECQE